MTTLVHLTPYVAFCLGVAMMMRALHLYSESRPHAPVSSLQKLAVWFGAMLAWPTLAGVLVLGWSSLAPTASQRAWPHAVALAISALVPLLLFGPPVVMLYVFLSAPFFSVGTLVPLVVVPLALVALGLGWFLPHVHFLGGQRRWIVPTIFAVLAIVGLIGEINAARFSVDQPQPDYVQYVLDKDTGAATWLSAATEPDAWTQQFFPNGYTSARAEFAKSYFFGDEFPVIQGPAPLLDLPAPQALPRDTATRDGSRTLTLHLSSPRGAPYLHVDMPLPGDLVSVTIDGTPLDVEALPAARRQRFALMFYNLPKDGIDVSLSVRGTGPLVGQLIDYSNGLPDMTGLRPRPPEFLPAAYDFRDPTVVRASFSIGE